MKKPKQLATKLTIQISIVLLAVFTVLALAITLSTHRDLQQREMEKL